MTAPKPTSIATTGADLLLDDLIEAFAKRLETGERLDAEAYIQEHPERAEQLRRILPAMLVLAELASSPGDSLSAGVSAEAADTPLGELGDFRILREVGRGGMGVVYEAEQISLGRHVALKVLPFAAALDPRQLQRFKNEAQAAAHLQHTHIVPVYYVGCERGVHFYAMQFIEGETLAAIIQELRQLAGNPTLAPATPSSGAGSLAQELASGRWAPARRRGAESQPTGPYLPAPAPHVGTVTPAVATLSTERSITSPAFFRTVANFGVQAAEALEHAHQLGVIHRDIKPGNLLVEANGRLWVTDFGLAHCQNQPGLTMSGDLVGTLRYMSPEQALAKRVAVDARTDVYSLGATLHELLTLEPAYNGRNREEILRQIAFEEPRPPRRVNPKVPGELETIVLKAIAKSPEDRYGSAQELADDLRRFLEDKPIKARRPSLRQRAVKWARRHKTVVRAAFVVLLLAMVALVVSTVFVWRAKEDLNRVTADLTQEFERERQNAYYQRIALAEREWMANHLSRYDRLLDECPENLRGWEWHYLKRLRCKTLAPLPHDAAVLCAAISPDGRRIASGSQDGIVNLWDASTGRNLARFVAHQDHVRGVAFSPDGRRLATGSWDKTVKVWDAQTLDQGGSASPLWEAQPGGVWSVAFSPDGLYLASGGGGGRQSTEVRIWDAATGTQVRALAGHGGGVYSVAFSPDGRCLASASADKTVRIWKLATGEELQTLVGHTEAVWCVAFSPDGRRLASGGGRAVEPVEGELKVWDAQTGQELFTLSGHTMMVFCVAFSPDGRRLASGSGDQTVKLWDMTTGQEALTLHGHRNYVRRVVFSPDGRVLISASHDGTVRVWDATPDPDTRDVEPLTLRGDGAPVISVAFDPVDGRLLASAHRDGTVQLWDAWNGRPRGALRVDRAGARAVAFSPDGQRLAAVSANGMVKIWDMTTWKEVQTLSLPTSQPPMTITFSPDGRSVAAAGYDFTVTIWDVASGKKRHELTGIGG